MRPLPHIAWILGYIGVLPFFALTIALLIKIPVSGIRLDWLLAAYAAVIISFLGAVHWGVLLGMQDKLQARAMPVPAEPTESTADEAQAINESATDEVTIASVTNTEVAMAVEAESTTLPEDVVLHDVDANETPKVNDVSGSTRVEPSVVHVYDPERDMRILLIYSVIPAVLAWAMLLLPIKAALVGMALLIVATYAADVFILFRRLGLLTDYAKLRLHLTLIVTLLLFAAALGGVK